MMMRQGEGGRGTGRGETLGLPQCRNVGKSQPVLITIDPMIFTAPVSHYLGEGGQHGAEVLAPRPGCDDVGGPRVKALFLPGRCRARETRSARRRGGRGARKLPPPPCMGGRDGKLETRRERHCAGQREKSGCAQWQGWSLQRGGDSGVLVVLGRGETGCAVLGLPNVRGARPWPSCSPAHAAPPPAARVGPPAANDIPRSAPQP
jgi:hypothetical protein